MGVVALQLKEWPNLTLLKRPSGRHEGRWWLEFWDGKEGDEVALAKEVGFGADEEAVAAIVEWLS